MNHKERHINCLDGARVVFLIVALLGACPFIKVTAQKQTFVSSGTFKVPDGVTRITVQAWGAGGGGSKITSKSKRGGGGGGGAFASGNISVTPGQSYSVVVGKGGNYNADGGSSGFGNNLVLADGGKGASNNSSTGGNGGSVSNSYGSVRYAGGDGGNNDNYYSGAGGGGAGSAGPGGNADGMTAGSGGSLYGGNGGTGVYYNGDGNDGNTYGGGGSGAATSGNSDKSGGSGANGQVIVTWVIALPLDNNTLGYSNGIHGTVCSAVDEHVSATLTSPTGTLFSYVNFASYGTPDGSCPNFTIGTCNATTSQSVVESYILGANSVDIPAENSIFTDPCVGTFKRLYITASYDEPICSGSLPPAISGSVPSGGDGSFSYLWESSTTGPASGFTTASGVNNQQNYSPAALTKTTWYRRTVTSAGYSLTSPVLVISVKPVTVITWMGSVSKDWDNPVNWCGGVPAAANNVEVPARLNEPVISSSTVCNNLTIDNGAALTISAGGSLRVNGSLANNAGTSGLILQSDSTRTASLIHNTDNVPATFYRYISGKAEAWHLLSSPVSNQAISGDWTPAGKYGNGTGYDLYAWNEPTNCWIYFLNTTTTVNWKTVHPESNFVPGRGYLYSVQTNNQTKQYTGFLNNGTRNIPVNASSTDAALKGFNLVGNPYPSAVDWQSATGWSRSNLSAEGNGYNIWVWNSAAGNYGIINSAGGTGTNGITRYIAPGQGFFVRAAVTGSMGLTNDARSNGSGNTWLKKSLGNDPSLLAIKITSTASTEYDEIQMYFGAEKEGTGAAKLFSPVATAPSLYMSYDQKDFSVRYLTDTASNPEVPVRFMPGESGKYTLTTAFDKNSFSYVILEDVRLHIFYDLRSNATYSFNAVKGDDPSRFTVHFVKTGDNLNPELPVKIYTSGSQLVVDVSSLNMRSRLMVFDLMGKLLLNNPVEGGTINSIPLGASSQVLIVRLDNSAGMITRKVMWINN